jgi:hypothetical protein
MQPLAHAALGFCFAFRLARLEWWRMHHVLAFLRITLLALIGAIVIVYAGDYLSVRYRMTKNKPKDPFESVQIEPTYGIPHKNGSAEIVIGDPETDTCVHAIFPHMGYEPCWYLARNSKNIIMLEILASK